MVFFLCKRVCKNKAFFHISAAFCKFVRRLEKEIKNSDLCKMYRISITTACTLLFAIIFQCRVQAQILNIEKAILDRDTSRAFIGNFTASFSLNNRSAAADAPVNLLGYNIKSNFAFFPGKHRLSFINEFNYLKINENPFLNTGYQHLRLDLWKDKKVYPEIFSQFQYDNFRGLFPRLLLGTALRHRLIKNDKITLIYSIGGMKEYERWQDPYTEELIPISLWKSTNYFIFRWQISKSADMNTINFFQTGYDAQSGVWRNRYSTEINLNTQVTDRLSLTNTFGLAYEDKPIVPITQTIYSLNTGLTFRIK